MLSGCATWTRYVLSVNVILACLDSTHCRPLQFIRKGRKLLIKITCKFLSACLLFGWLCEFLQRHQAQQWPYVFQSLCVIAARSSKWHHHCFIGYLFFQLLEYVRERLSCRQSRCEVKVLRYAQQKLNNAHGHCRYA